jgi:hypothetical protein
MIDDDEMKKTDIVEAMAAKANEDIFGANEDDDDDSIETTTLSDAMIAKADELNLPHHHNLRVLARQFNEAAKGFYEEHPTYTPKQLLGAWARARRAWCDFTGEPLI